MALRDQPYLPLYVNDFLSDEKLNECSAEATGVYIRLMCLMHKSSEYGYIILRERDIEKFTSQIKSKLQANHEQACVNHIQIMALALQRKMPYTAEEIENGLCELLDAGVIKSEDYKIYQPRMVRDGALSSVRAKAGSAGGKAVRNSATKKNYNEPGFLYVAEDCGDKSCHKVGITKDLRNRLNGLRRQSQRNMQFVYTAEVDDMGTTEDNVLTMLNDIRDGEWVYGHSLNEIMKAVNQCVKITNKSQANHENENEYEIEDEINKKEINGEIQIPFDGALLDAFNDWIAYKEEKRQPYKPRGLKSLISQISRYAEQFGDTATANAIRDSMASNYQGIVFDRIGKGQQTDTRRRAKAPSEYTTKGSFFDVDT